jgi:hypothetical protein
MARTIVTAKSKIILWVIADTRFDLPRARKPPSAESGN